VITNVNSATKIVTRKGMTWTFKETGAPAFFEEMCAEYGDDVLSKVLSEGDYYPPMLDGKEKVEIEDACLRATLYPLLEDCE
jgi:hypothetical protein